MVSDTKGTSYTHILDDGFVSTHLLPHNSDSGRLLFYSILFYSFYSRWNSSSNATLIIDSNVDNDNINVIYRLGTQHLSWIVMIINYIIKKKSNLI